MIARLIQRMPRLVNIVRDLNMMVILMVISRRQIRFQCEAVRIMTLQIIHTLTTVGHHTVPKWERVHGPLLTRL